MKKLESNPIWVKVQQQTILFIVVLIDIFCSNQ